MTGTTTPASPAREELLTLGQAADMLRLRRTATSTALASASAPSPVRLGRRAVRWRRQDLLAWLITLQASPSPALVVDGELVTFDEVCQQLSLGRTATRAALARQGAPCPVRLNGRALRYWAADVDAWLVRLQAGTVDPATVEPVPAPRPAVARGGRPRKRML